jgi:UDP-N-acetylglucosamine 1-carboxyvinyltransferase
MQNSKILIKGRNKLAGTVSVSGAKNAALPELAAVVLSPGQFTFSNVPKVKDIHVLLKALKNIGAEFELTGNSVDIQLETLCSGLVPPEIVETTRASVLLLGPLLARHGYAKVSMPGGCPIGDRKINYHIDGLEKMGASIRFEEGHIIAEAPRLKAIDFRFPGKTVTGTENLVMAASLGEGTTILRNCALEPEIGDLVQLLLSMGAEIRADDPETLVIEGKTSLNGATHSIIPDRIEMGTYVIAGCLEDNDIKIENAAPHYIDSLLNILKEMGCTIQVDGDSMAVHSCGELKPVRVETEPYPGFPTDLQAQLTTLLTQAEGTSQVVEHIFNDRFQHALELNKLGADIHLQGNTAVINGKTTFKGRDLRATDLRASAALVLGGLIAEGETVVHNAYQLFRGYENMPEKLQKLGACVKIIDS